MRTETALGALPSGAILGIFFNPMVCSEQKKILNIKLIEYPKIQI